MPWESSRKEELTWCLSALLSLSMSRQAEIRKAYLKQLIPEDYRAYAFFLIPSRTMSQSVSFQNDFTIVIREKDRPWQARNLLVPGSESSPHYLSNPSDSNLWALLIFLISFLGFPGLLRKASGICFSGIQQIVNINKLHLAQKL